MGKKEFIARLLIEYCTENRAFWLADFSYWNSQLYLPLNICLRLKEVVQEAKAIFCLDNVVAAETS